MQIETTELTAAWLAEHIMGWESGRDGWPVPGWNPLEHIGHAWEVVEAIRANPASNPNYRYRIEIVELHELFQGKARYRARFACDGSELFVHHFTVPQAICHAAYSWWLEYGQDQEKAD